ncbi:MAG TPA: hypothetical protein VFQ60_03415 [Patescibacteria group bacterium]|nr:hypothetical protein [Patescibacteria group bacterium]
MSNPSRILAQCPLCQAAYQQGEVHLLGERGSTQLFHCSCKSCGYSVLAVVLENSGWVSSVGLVTDLEVRDAIRFQSFSSITTDECIEFHRELEGKSREFCERISTAA